MKCMRIGKAYIRQRFKIFTHGFRLRLGSRRCDSFIIAGQHTPIYVGHAFPRAEEIEIAEILCQFDGFIHHAFLFVVVANFDDSRSARKIFTQRVTFKTIIRKDAAQIRIA